MKNPQDVLYASCIISCCVISRDIVELIGEDMNELKYSYVLEDVIQFEIFVTHVDPMNWSILARLGNLDVTPTISSQ